MELDDLKTRWQEYDRKLDVIVRLNTTLVRDSLKTRTASALRWAEPSIWASVLTYAVVLLGLGMFNFRHFNEPPFLVPGVALHLTAIVLLAVSVREWIALRSIDLDGPVLASQQKVDEVRILRIRTTKWVLFTAPLLWLPVLIVGAKGFLGLNVYALGTPWIAANVAFGVAFIPLMMWVSRRFAHRAGPFLQQVMDDFAGPNLTAARAHLEEMRRFEKE